MEIHIIFLGLKCLQNFCSTQIDRHRFKNNQIVLRIIHRVIYTKKGNRQFLRMQYFSLMHIEEGEKD